MSEQATSDAVGKSEFPQLPELQPGSSLTPFSVSLVNPIIRMYNSLRNIEGNNGVAATLTAGNLVIELTGDESIQPVPTIGDGSGGGGTSGAQYSGAWSSGGSYEENELVTHTIEGWEGLYIRISTTSGAGTAPGATGYATDWTLLARRFEDTLTLKTSATEHIKFDADAGTVIVTQGSEVITLDVGTSKQIKITDGTNTITLDTSADEIRITDGSIYTTIEKDKIFQTNAAGTIKFDWDMTAEKFRIDFSDGGSVEMNKTDAGGKDLTIVDADYCDAGVPKTLRCVGVIF
jgi:hypothetical protein